MKNRILFLVIVSMLFSVLAAQCGGTPAQAPAAPVNQPAAPTNQPAAPANQPAAPTKKPAAPANGIDPLTLLNERCTVCHSLDRVHNAHKDEAGWKTTTDRMIGHGAKISADEQAALVKYLAATYK